jgi:signal transduction histidine kinase
VDVENASRILLQQLWIITAVLFVLSITLAIILAHMFSRPIRRVTQAAREMASGMLDIHLPVCSKDEVGQLTVALNELGVELKKTENLRHELIANVSHELRSPLTVIRGFAETVRDVTWPDQEKRSSQLTMIADEASRLSKIVSDILDYSRLQAGVDHIEITDFSVCSKLSEVIDHYKPEAEKKNLSLNLDCPDLTVRFDQNRFSQVLINLLNNAINHAAIGSSVFINVAVKSHEARVSIQNSGKSIPAEELSQIWDRYYQAEQINDNKPLGTGLGLSIVKSIFDVHGVSYGVHSQNELTVFWFDTLPLTKD